MITHRTIHLCGGACALMMMVLGLVIGCSSGPAALSSVIRPSDQTAYKQQLNEHHNDAKAAYLSWRSLETGKSIETLAHADEQISLTKNPFTRNDPWTVQRGALLYQTHCANCHGTQANGRNPDESLLPGAKDFHNSHIRAAVNMSDSYVAGWFNKVYNGVTSEDALPDGSYATMPAMKKHLTREQIWLAVTYLTSEDKITEELIQ